MAFVFDVLTVFQLLILVFGSVVVYFAGKSYSRKKSRAMLLLAIGFAFITVGAGLAGILFQFLGWDLQTVETVQAAGQAVGFFVIVYSLIWTRE